MHVTYILGAGASHSYKNSRFGVPLPLANGFFNTYTKLPLSEDFEVRVGDIINYIRDVHGIPWQRFNTFNMNVEAFMTELDGRIRRLAEKIRKVEITEQERGNYYSWVKAYDQMIFLFAHVLNETQNGPTSKEYTRLVSMCDEKDTLITFNWDTLLDRALYESGGWKPDTCYGVHFRNILDVDWRKPEADNTSTLLLKLHGSTNWLVNYVTRHLSTGERVMVTGQPTHGKMIVELEMGFSLKDNKLQIRPKTHLRKWGGRPIPSAGELAATPCCFLRGPKPFHTYNNRYRPGYEDFCYFFPPNDPIDDIPMMPLIVPPTSFKLYDEFQHVLDPLWKQAQERIVASRKIVIIGYSFPTTDQRVLDLLRPLLSQGNAAPLIQIVNPAPDNVFHRITVDLGIKPDHVQVVAKGFTDYLEM